MQVLYTQSHTDEVFGGNLQHHSTPITEPINAAIPQQQQKLAVVSAASVQTSDATQLATQEPSDGTATAMIEVCIDLTEEPEAAEQSNTETKMKKKAIIQRGGSDSVTKGESESAKKKKKSQQGGKDAGPSSESQQARKRKAQSRKNPEPKKYVTKKPKKEEELLEKKKKKKMEPAVTSEIITDSMFGDLELPTAEVL